ncbi:MAG: hypothetical protein D6689_00120 [Deltaproteobacteria bacterium]|nr:MAG: hypothetical protein D6689_00120 [Deltaproteobacteria bacterium]
MKAKPVVVAALAAAGLGTAAATSTSIESRAVTAEVLGEIEAELGRSLASLEVPGEPKPYFIAYKVTEVEVNDVSASLGATLAKRERHFVNLDASVRVGDYQLDNANFVIPRQEDVDGLASITLPLEATPRIARKAAWLATDAAFQEALAQYTAKQASLRRRTTAGAAVPSYTREPPVVAMDPVVVPPLESASDLEALAARVSLAFRDRPTIRESHVAYTSFLERRWYLNAEGTRAHDTRRVTGVVIVASTRADDGEVLSLYTSHYGHTLADLPPVAALEKEAASLADQLDALRAAPVLGNYTGPVLFEGVGAAGIVRHTLAPQLSGTPVPDGSPDEDFLGGKLTDRIGLRVVSPLLSVIDDPTTNRAAGHALIGGYRFDDEGVPGRRVQVIDRGKLVTLLMSRTPSAKIAHSNGHARRAGTGIFTGSPTNLFLRGHRGKSARALRRALIAEAKAQGLDYGLIVAQFDDPVVTANGELGPRQLLEELNARRGSELPRVALAYRLYTDGRIELVRGVQLAETPLRIWRDVIAVGNRPAVLSFLATTDDGTGLRLRGGGPGFVPSAGIESSIVTPALLFRELDAKRAPASLIPPPPVPKP